MDEHNLSRGLLDDAENPMGRSIDNDGIIKVRYRDKPGSELFNDYVMSFNNYYYFVPLVLS